MNIVSSRSRRYAPEKSEAALGRFRALPFGRVVAPGEKAIETTDLAKTFGHIVALDNLTLSVPQGSVYALLGRNGAGKSTFIQILLGLLEPSSGSVRVLGQSPISSGAGLRQRIGYIPERLAMYDWMTVAQAVRFVAAQYPGWSNDEERHHMERFHTPIDRKVGALSRGQRALLSLVMALGHRPELVLLDECTSGMDAIARNEFDRSVIDSLRESGRTILFASHQIRELERLCDWVGILHEGRLLLQMPIDRLKASIRMVLVKGPDDIVEGLSTGHVLARRRIGREWLLTIAAPPETPAAELLPQGLDVFETVDLSLEEIFIALLEEEGREL